jgi:hypothetical protein
MRQNQMEAIGVRAIAKKCCPIKGRARILLFFSKDMLGCVSEQGRPIMLQLQVREIKGICVIL